MRASSPVSNARWRSGCSASRVAATRIDRYSALLPRLGRFHFDPRGSFRDRLHERVAPDEGQERVGGVGQLDSSQAGAEELDSDSQTGRREDLRDGTALGVQSRTSSPWASIASTSDRAIERTR